MIWFDGMRAYPSANYHVQRLYSLYTGDFAMPATTDMPHTYASATERDGFTYVKVVNASDETLEAEVDAAYDFGALNRVIRMEGELGDYNTLEEPAKIAPVDVAPTAARTAVLPPRSFSVLVFRK